MRIFAVLALLLTAQTVDARPPPDDDDYDEPTSWRHDRAFIEWSTWLRGGYGVERAFVSNVARTTQPPRLYDQTGMFDAAIGIDGTVPLPTSKIRLGPWLELRPQGVFAGAEVTIAGRELDMFFYTGERVWTLRAGSSMTHVTGAIAFGYRCPWKLWGPYADTTRYMIGARIVASATRAAHDPNDWSMSLGLELEPVGALRYLAGIRAWY